MPNRATKTPGATVGEEDAATSNAAENRKTAPAEATRATPRLELPNELNQRISRVDAEIAELHSELARAGKTVKSSLSQLGNGQADLTTRVSDIYRQLGDLDRSYQGLAQKSAQISDEIQSLVTILDAVAAQSEAGLEGLSEEHQALVARTEELANKSRLTTQALDEAIRENAKALKGLDTRLIEEIETLSRSSQERDQALTERLDQTRGEVSRAHDEINAAKARMLKLQAVDQALEKRAQALEATVAELTERSRQLARSTQALDQRTTELGAAITTLQARADAQEARTGELDAAHAETRRELRALGLLERRHFRGLAAGVALLAVALTGLFLLHRHAQTVEAANQVALTESLNGLTGQQATIAAEVAQARRDTDEADTELRRQLASVDRRLTALDDQVDSVGGRLANLRPGRGFGGDNVIHGPQWLAARPAGHYTIQVAAVGDKQALYELAERYGHDLTGELAYVPFTANGTAKFALFMGAYANRQELGEALAALPPYLNGQRPQGYPISRVQAHIGQ